MSTRSKTTEAIYPAEYVIDRFVITVRAAVASIPYKLEMASSEIGEAAIFLCPISIPSWLLISFTHHRFLFWGGAARTTDACRKRIKSFIKTEIGIRPHLLHAFLMTHDVVPGFM